MENTLTTILELKALTSISENMDVELLQPHLLIAQQLYIAPILGDALYSSILASYNNNSISGDTLTLHEEYIVPAIAYGAWFSVSPFIHMKTQRAGIHTQSSDNTIPVSVEELSLYIRRVETLKLFYCDRLEQYLITNANKFPLFRQNDVKVNNGSSLYLGFRSKRISRDNIYY